MNFLDIIRHGAGPRLDANETAAFSRELEYVHAEVIEAKYPELKFRNVVPIKSGAPLGATSHRYFEIDGYGSAKFLDNMATEDFPTAEVRGTENTGKIRSIGAKWMVTVEELRAAALMRVKPDAEKAKLAKRAIETMLDKAVWGGRTTALNQGGFAGLIHDDSSTLYTPDATYGSNGNWDTATPEKIVHDVSRAIDAAFIETKGAFNQYDLFLPPEMGVKLNRPMYFVDGSNNRYLNQSIAAYMLENVARLRSVSVDNFRLTNAGASSKCRGLLFPRDPEVLDAFIPLDFEQFAPEFSGMSFVTHCHAKYGGLRIKHIKAIRRIDATATSA